MARGRLGNFLTAGLAFIGVSAAAAGALAGPQTLALVATVEPVQLICDGDNCRAEFSAFCLQPNRISPKAGTRYLMTRKSRIALNGIDREGRAIVLDPQEALRFRSLRGHTAIQISLAPDLKQRLDLQSVAVTLSENVTITPAAVDGDDNPLSAGELAMVEMALRPLGATMVDKDSDGMAAARVTNRLVNLLPEYDGDAAGSAKHWRALMAQADQAGLSAKASRLAQNAYDLCRYYADRVVPGDIRRCMQGQHDRLMKVLNSAYWQAIRIGS